MSHTIFSRWTQRAVCFLIASGPALAQGDTCSNAIAIPANGHVDVDTSAATTSGFLGAVVCVPTPSVLQQDRFYSWTAPANGNYDVFLADAAFQADMTVYAGSDCQAACLEVGSVVNGADAFVALTGIQTGDAFMIQVGGVAAGESGRARLAIVPAISGGCAVEGGDGFEPNDTCATAFPVTPGTLFGLRTGISVGDEDYFSIEIPNHHRLQVFATGLPNTVFLALFQPNCASVGNQSSSITYYNLTGMAETRVIRAKRDHACADYRLEFTVEPLDCSSQAFGSNVDCELARPIGTGPDLQFIWVAQNHARYYVACVPPGATLDVQANFAHDSGDINLDLLERGSAACTTGTGPGVLASASSQTDDEAIQWTNPGPSQQDVVVRVSVAPTSAFECSRFDLATTVSSACSLGPITRFCSPALPNSTGMPTVLTATVDPSLPAGIHFESTQGPPGQFGFFLISNVSHDPWFVSQGQLCFGLFGVFQRYNYNVGTNFNSIGQFNAQGVFQNLGGTSQSGSGFDLPFELPNFSVPTIQAGQVWFFQLWHREDGGASNFSDGVRIPF